MKNVSAWPLTAFCFWAAACGESDRDAGAGELQDASSGLVDAGHDASDAAGSDAAGSDAAGTDASIDPAHDGGMVDPVFAGVDCTTSNTPCIAAAGLRNGTPFTCRAISPPLEVTRIELKPNRWTIHCDEVPDFTLGVDFPLQVPGPIQASTSAPTEDGGFNFYLRPVFSSQGASMTQGSSNLQSGTLQGTLGADGLATGSLIARWGPPSPDCESGYVVGACAEGAFRLTFRVVLP